MFMRIIHRMDLADGASRIFHSIRKMLGNFCWEATSVKQRGVIYNNPSEIYSIKVTDDTSFTDLLVNCNGKMKHAIKFSIRRVWKQRAGERRAPLT